MNECMTSDIGRTPWRSTARSPDARTRRRTQPSAMGTARGCRATTRAILTTSTGAGESMKVTGPNAAQERVAGGDVAGVVAVGDRVPALADPEPVGHAVAPQVAVLDEGVVEGCADPPLDLRPDVVVGHGPVGLVPATVVADERGGLEGEHPEAHPARRTGHVRRPRRGSPARRSSCGRRSSGPRARGADARTGRRTPAGRGRATPRRAGGGCRAARSSASRSGRRRRSGAGGGGRRGRARAAPGSRRRRRRGSCSSAHVRGRAWPAGPRRGRRDRAGSPLRR